MNAPRIRRAHPLLALLAVWLAAACVDTTPLSYVAPEKDAVAPVDAAADAPLIRSCRKCLSGDGEPCRPQYDACVGIDKCVNVLNCVLDHGCFELSDLAKRYACGSPCLSQAGTVAGNNPVIQALAQMNVCIVNSCSDACFSK